MSVALALFTLTSSCSSPDTGTSSASMLDLWDAFCSSLDGGGGGVSPLDAGDAGEGEARPLRDLGAIAGCVGVVFCKNWRRGRASAIL